MPLYLGNSKKLKFNLIKESTEVSQYLYNGMILPPLPELDKTVWTNVIVVNNNGAISLRILQEIVPIAKSPDGVPGLSWKSPNWVYTLKDTGEWSSGWLDEDGGSLYYKYAHWTNTDLRYADDYPDETFAGTLYLAASEPIPVYNTVLSSIKVNNSRLLYRAPVVVPSQWETLFEGEVTAVETTYNGCEVTDFTFATTPLFVKGEGIRVTVDGVSHIETAVSATEDSGGMVGNNWICAPPTNTEVEDNGLDYWIYTDSVNSWFTINDLYLRNPGTYQVKIERALFEPVAYSYNGVRLPALPEWDKETYPYAAIVNTNYVKNYILILSSIEMVVGMPTWANPDGMWAPGIKPKENATCLWCSYKCVDNEWVIEDAPTEGVFDFMTWSADDAWSNHDIPNQDGTYPNKDMFVTASEPVPVYE